MKPKILLMVMLLWPTFVFGSMCMQACYDAWLMAENNAYWEMILVDNPACEEHSTQQARDQCYWEAQQKYDDASYQAWLEYNQCQGDCW